MSRRKIIALAGAAALLALPARAADYPQPQPIPQPMPFPVPIPVPQFIPVVEDFAGGWYLRGDIGMSNQQVGSLYNIIYNDPGVSVRNVDKQFDSAPFFGIGFGYQFNNWFHADLTVEYRGKANFHGMDIATFPGSGGTGILPDVYTASKSELLFMANAYLDLGTWWCLTPFVGVGVGMSYNRISSFKDVGTTTITGNCDCNGTGVIASTAYADEGTKWNFAYALHAGLAYKVTNNFVIELAYRYLNLGDAVSGDLIGFDGTNSRVNPMEFHTITSHDIKLGVRWIFGGDSVSSQPVYAPPPPQPIYAQPVYAPPQPIYAPPPPQVYAPPPQPMYVPQPQMQPLYSPQPPIMRRG